MVLALALSLSGALPAPLMAGEVSHDTATVGSLDVWSGPDCPDCMGGSGGHFASACLTLCTASILAVLPQAAASQQSGGTCCAVLDGSWIPGGVGAPDPEPPRMALHG